jgi:hypothetical protein
MARSHPESAQVAQESHKHPLDLAMTSRGQSRQGREGDGPLRDRA